MSEDSALTIAEHAFEQLRNDLKSSEFPPGSDSSSTRSVFASDATTALGILRRHIG